MPKLETLYTSIKGLKTVGFPLAEEQLCISDVVIRDLFGVSGKEFYDLKAAIAALQKGELIIKDSTASILGIGNKWKKIKVAHLI